MITFSLPHFQVNDVVIYTKRETLKAFNTAIFDGLSSCSEYTFQMDLILNPKASSFVEKVLATLEGGPFMSSPSTNSSLLKLEAISTDTNSIQFELTGKMYEWLSSRGLVPCDTTKVDINSEHF